MKRKLMILLSIFVLASLLASPVAASDDGPFEEYDLTKWKIPITLEQTVPINIILIGYEPTQVDKTGLLFDLPETYVPLVRYPQFYGVTGREMGLKFNFTYKVSYTNKKFEDKFFKFLAKTGVPGDPTAYQQAYNDQASNVQDVTGPVLYIDAPSVEKWLKSHTSSMLKGGKRSYTVYFINWYGREDFQYHVYTKTDMVDPDTGYNFGAQRATRKMIAWGGSYSRSWFYDLSAGPEAWTDNWAVDTLDLDENGFEDYRMPAIWEYTPGGYRDPAVLASDLGLVTRYVAINLLFTTSPLYDPMVTAPGLDGSKVEHIEIFEDDPAASGLDWINQSYIFSKLAAFQPYYNWQVNIEDNDPIDAAAQLAFRIFAEIPPVPDDCWNTYGTPFGELFCFFDAHQADYVPAYSAADYVGKVFGFNTIDANMGAENGLLGFADDNWVDGTQSYVFMFDTDYYRSIGYGFSTTAVHEFGHHIGMSHPHDGYDSEDGVDYGPADEFYFVWSGDESNTVMHYMDLSDSFGQFDQDNMYRYETAGYLQATADLLAQVLADPENKLVKGLVKLSAAKAKVAVGAFKTWNYQKAAWNARRAYEAISRAAQTLEIYPAVEQVIIAAPNLDVPHEGDPIRFPDD